jgi:hypothetical protein
VNRKGKECEMIVWLFGISESEKKVRGKNKIYFSKRHRCPYI